MSEGKFFFLKSKMHGKVLDVCGGCSDPGTEVILWDQKDSDNDNQVWYEDPITGTIRSKSCDLCFDINGDNRLTIGLYDPDNDNQQWTTSGNRVQNRKDADRVLDIAAANQDSGAGVCAWGYHGNDNQLWEFEYLPARYFHVRSQMNGKVLDVKGANADPGAKVITYNQNDELSDNQLWYQDRHGLIRSKLNDFVFDSSDGKITLNPFAAGNTDQMWVPIPFEHKIVSATKPSCVIDIKGAKDKDGAKVICYEWHDATNQMWDFDYVE